MFSIGENYGVATGVYKIETLRLFFIISHINDVLCAYKLSITKQ